ncbi:FAD-dependent oxidoreductase [Gordonia sp. X0973]|uniref:FAD-dependent oxidoreductase n=1 Tax=Gordonia sp. X0973 TaxID=2742602 RepID=UPI000F52DD31|nr:FAD-dependent oxidoreductase [Gordonia sp. X0973]QKT05917.1 FAD-dependent oxidoreductase [Gordonia sp. X0973]
MAFVITQSCCSDAGCVSVCPVNCIHPTPEERGFGTSEILHIDPDTCIDCGACADACPVNAIFPADRLAPRDRVFVDINAEFYKNNPDVSTGWGDVTYPTIPRLPDGLRVAIVGTGPSGGYALRTLLHRTQARMTVLDKLPTPGGLVRAGVAPDHPSTKDVMRTFDLCYRDPRVTMATNVEVGPDAAAGQITPAELAEHFDAVFYAVGASQSRRLDIPGEDLDGSIAASDLVAWYNAVPDAVGPPIPALSGRLGSGRAVVVGTGNVALDIARMLVSPPEALARTDIADRALRLLREQNVGEVVVLGRRGQDSAAYTDAEYRALAAVPDVEVVVCAEADGPLPDLSGPVALGRRRIVFLFHTSPVGIDGDERVESVTVATGGREHRIAADLVVRSIGYRGTPITGLPFDEESGRFPNVDGRLVGDDGEVVPGAYVIGWAGRGASGGIGANKLDALGVVERFVGDVADGAVTPGGRDAGTFDELLRSRRRKVVGYRGMRRIDQAERAAGAREGRPRVKFTELGEMLAVAGRRRGIG